MPFSAYSRLNGACSVAIGILFIAAGFPGLLAPAASWWLAAPGVLAVLVPIALWARRRGVPWSEPGRWLTDRPLREARQGLAPMDERRLRIRLVGETVLWGAVALAVFVGFTTSRPFAYATGWASLAYGLLELLASPPQIRAAEREHGVAYRVCRRPGIGTPDVTY
jgi:hypothetical protein